MDIFKFMFLIFILAALSIGVSMREADMDIEVITNATALVNSQLENLSLEAPSETNIPNANGLYNVLEKYIQFTAAFYTEFMEAGVRFGYNNPDYFNPLFIMKIIIYVLIFYLVALLIKPVGMLCIFIVLIFLWLKDKIKERRKKKGENNK